MVHVKFVEIFREALIQGIEARFTGLQRYLRFVKDGVTRAVEILPESDIEQSRSRGCDVEPKDCNGEHHTF